jgi:hypothetical protein
MRSQRDTRSLHTQLPRTRGAVPIIRAAMATATATAGAVILAASPVAAAAPANDSYAAAEPLTLGIPVVADTTEATPEELDLEVIQACPFGAPPSTTKTVWYRWDSGTDPPPTVSVLASGSSFPPYFAVAMGEPGSFTTLTCGVSAVMFETEPDVTYHVMLFSPFDRGGTTTLVLDEARPPTIELTVDPIGQFDPKTGSATISGDYRCSDAISGYAFGSLTQSVGRFEITGAVEAELPCDGGTHDWAAVTLFDNGRFAGGKAIAVIDAFACSIPFCVNITVEQTVSLRR